MANWLKPLGGKIKLIGKRLAGGARKILSKVGDFGSRVAAKTAGVVNAYHQSGAPGGGLVKKIHTTAGHASSALQQAGAGNYSGALKSGRAAYGAARG
jgi:hypothetical protein